MVPTEAGPAPTPARDSAFDAAQTLARIRNISSQAGFNRWAGIEVVRVESGLAEIAIAWKDEFGQYSGFLHAGVIAALIDTACGFAAATVTGRVLASHFSVNCLAPAVGSRFHAIARVTRAGRRQVFTSGELYAHKEGVAKLVANGETILIPVEAG